LLKVINFKLYCGEKKLFFDEMMTFSYRTNTMSWILVLTLELTQQSGVNKSAGPRPAICGFGPNIF